MKVAAPSPDLLVAEERPIAIVGILALFASGLCLAAFRAAQAGETRTALLVGAFATVVALVLVFTAPFVRAEFSRATGRLEIVRRGLFGERCNVYPLARLRQAREELSEAGGSSGRLVLVFAPAMLDEIDPHHRAELERAQARGLRHGPLNEIPFTYYYSGLSDAGAAAAAINAWIGRG
jgi:hypothetical protein